MKSPSSSSVSSAAPFSRRTAVMVRATSSGDASSRRTCPRTRASTSLAEIERTGQVSWPLRLAPRQHSSGPAGPAAGCASASSPGRWGRGSGPLGTPAPAPRLLGRRWVLGEDRVHVVASALAIAAYSPRIGGALVHCLGELLAIWRALRDRLLSFTACRRGSGSARPPRIGLARNREG
jgi:hypothetical protein